MELHNNGRNTSERKTTVSAGVYVIYNLDSVFERPEQMYLVRVNRH